MTLHRPGCVCSFCPLSPADQEDAHNWAAFWEHTESKPDDVDDSHPWSEADRLAERDL